MTSLPLVFTIIGVAILTVWTLIEVSATIVRKSHKSVLLAKTHYFEVQIGKLMEMANEDFDEIPSRISSQILNVAEAFDNLDMTIYDTVGE